MNIIRPATLDDLDALMQLYYQGWQREYQSLINPDYLAAMPDSQKSRDYMTGLLTTRADVVVQVALHDDVLAGFLAAGFSRDVDDKSMAEIYAVYIDAGHQGRGLGHALFTGSVPLLRAKAFAHLHVWTFAKNVAAQKSYTRWGGVHNGLTRTVSIAGDALEEVAFYWAL